MELLEQVLWKIIQVKQSYSDYIINENIKSYLNKSYNVTNFSIDMMPIWDFYKFLVADTDFTSHIDTTNSEFTQIQIGIGFTGERISEQGEVMNSEFGVTTRKHETNGVNYQTLLNTLLEEIEERRQKISG